MQTGVPAMPRKRMRNETSSSSSDTSPDNEDTVADDTPTFVTVNVTVTGNKLLDSVVVRNASTIIPISAT